MKRLLPVLMGVALLLLSSTEVTKEVD